MNHLTCSGRPAPPRLPGLKMSTGIDIDSDMASILGSPPTPSCTPPRKVPPLHQAYLGQTRAK